MNKFSKKIVVLNLLLIIFLTLDRLTKVLILEELPSQGVSLISGLLKLTLYQNINIAFGIKLPLPLIYFLIITILLLIVILLFCAYQKKDLWLIWWLGLIIVGALSNLIDRLVYGQVIDFINIPFWSIFNLADSLILIGVIGWLIKIFLQDYQVKKNKL